MKRLKSILLLASVFLVISTSFAQGINFGHDFEEALTQAKKENKIIFVDFYTSWCMPCKQMSAEVFPQKEAGDYFNKNFVNLKIQCDDNGKGVKLGEKYKIIAYPTLMFLDSDGNPIHSEAGGTSVAGLIELAKIATDPNRNQLNLVKKFDAGNRDINFLIKYFEMLMGSYQNEKATTDFENYFKTLSKSQKTSKNIFELMEIVKPTPFSAPFEFLEKNKKTFYKNVGKTKVDNTIATRYLWYLKGIEDKGLRGKEVDLTEFNTKMNQFKSKNYPYYDEYAEFYAVFNSRTADNKDYDVNLYMQRGTEFLRKYGEKNDAYTLALASLLGNFTGRKNQTLVGIKWMEDLLARNNDPKYYNTYFYITWRNGLYDKAIKIAEQMKANAVEKNQPTEDIDKNIQMVKNLREKYKDK